MKILLPLLTLFVCGVVNAQETSILYLGNSYTYTANLPQMVSELASANGVNVYYESSLPGGHTLEQHSTNVTSLQKISSRDWDFVVIQEQSQKPSFPPSQVAAETYPFAEILVDSIKSNYECTEPVFFMTWGRRDGDHDNCQFYTPLCTFEGMNARLRESYLEMAEDNNTTVAPCGAAWQQLKFEDATFWNELYSGDGSHPSAKGTYLNACVFYATMFRESPVGLNYYANIGQVDAEILQQLAEDMVIDSTSNWFIGHQDVVSNASATMQPDLVSFQFDGSSENATEHQWTLGDGNSSVEENPLHQYSPPTATYTYTVSHVALSECGSDTTTFLVTTEPLSVGDSNPLHEIQLVVHNNRIRITNELSNGLEVSVFETSGKLLLSETLNSHSTTTLNQQLISGVYLIRLRDDYFESTRKLLLR